MGKGHIEFTLSVRMCMFYCLFVCMFQNCVQPITSLCMVESENFLAQMILKTRLCVMCKNHVARLKVKVTVGKFVHSTIVSHPNFIMHSGI